MQSKQHYRTTLFTLFISALLMLGGCSNQAPVVEGPAAENLAKGKAFLEANKDKEGIEIMPSGIQYRIITENEEGKTPRLTDNVKMHYTMSGVDGTVYYDSHSEGKPSSVQVKYALAGWRKTLTKMTVGSKWEVFVPTHMAYSSRGFQDMVAPNEALIFEIELLEIIW